MAGRSWQEKSGANLDRPLRIVRVGRRSQRCTFQPSRRFCRVQHVMRAPDGTQGWASGDESFLAVHRRPCEDRPAAACLENKIAEPAATFDGRQQQESLSGSKNLHGQLHPSATLVSRRVEKRVGSDPLSSVARRRQDRWRHEEPILAFREAWLAVMSLRVNFAGKAAACCCERDAPCGLGAAAAPPECGLRPFPAMRLQPKCRSGLASCAPGPKLSMARRALRRGRHAAVRNWLCR